MAINATVKITNYNVFVKVFKEGTVHIVWTKSGRLEGHGETKAVRKFWNIKSEKMTKSKHD